MWNAVRFAPVLIDGISLVWCLVLASRMREARLLTAAGLLALLLLHHLNDLTSDITRATLGVPSVHHESGELAAALLAFLSVVIVGRLISAYRGANEQLVIENAYFENLFQNSPEAVVLLDNQDRVLRCNQEFERLFGFTTQEMHGHPINELIVPDFARVEAGELSRRALRGERVSSEAVRQRKSGERVDVSILGAPILTTEGQLAVYGIYRDISERKRAEERLRHSALHDPLTWLPNRSYFHEVLSSFLERSRRDPSFGYALLFLDIDRFKRINDTFGHAGGDRVLAAIAERLRGCLRPADVVARLGGDEFTLLLADIHETAAAVATAERVQAELGKAFVIEEENVTVTASIGIALSSRRYEDPEEILRDADIAMYQAKTINRGSWQAFTSAMHNEAVADLRLDSGLRRALDRQEFRLHYQPVVDLQTAELTAFEALLRWEHPTRGLLRPGDFIAAAEEAELIGPIGDWVLTEACHQAHYWRQLWRDSAAPLPPVSVNLSARQIALPSLVDRISTILDDTGARPTDLQLEITESTLLTPSDANIQVIGALHELGLEVFIDDFGTGYSSLSYLHRFPIAGIKVDRSFVERIDQSPSSASILRSIVALGEDLGLKVVAEGIENAAQRSALLDLGYRLGQGFLFAPPLETRRAELMLEDSMSRAD